MTIKMTAHAPDPHARRRIGRLAGIAADLASGVTVVELNDRLKDDVDVPDVTNVLRAPLDQVTHANVRALGAFGDLIPGP
jgi:hypothetical protein